MKEKDIQKEILRNEERRRKIEDKERRKGRKRGIQKEKRKSE